MSHRLSPSLRRPSSPPLPTPTGLPLRALCRRAGLLAALCGSTVAQAQLQIHTDPSGFATIAGTLTSESFNAFTSDQSSTNGSTLVLRDLAVQGAWSIVAAPQDNGIDASAMLRISLSYGGWSDLKFQQPIYAFGAWFNRVPSTLGIAADSLNGYGSYRTLLSYQPGASGGWQFLGFTSDQPFNRIVMEGAGCCSLTVTMDNLAYATSVSTVPEPQVWSLLAAGLVGLRWRLRRAASAQG